MRKRATLLAVLILAATASGAYLLFEWIKELGYESCVLSIESEFGKALASDLELSRRIVVTNEWRTLDEEEERILFDKFIALGRKFDCKQFGEYANGDVLRGDRGRIDVWRDRQQVHVRIEVDDGRSRRFPRPDSSSSRPDKGAVPLYPIYPTR